MLPKKRHQRIPLLPPPPEGIYQRFPSEKNTSKNATSLRPIDTTLSKNTPFGKLIPGEQDGSAAGGVARVEVSLAMPRNRMHVCGYEQAMWQMNWSKLLSCITLQF